MQLPLLRKRWKQVVFGVLFQYCHGLTTQLAHRMHRPMAQPLHDLGFAVLPVCALNPAWGRMRVLLAVQHGPLADMRAMEHKHALRLVDLRSCYVSSSLMIACIDPRPGLT